MFIYKFILNINMNRKKQTIMNTYTIDHVMTGFMAGFILGCFSGAPTLIMLIIIANM